MTNIDSLSDCRYFLTYSGVKLPLNLVSPIGEADTRNRNTFMRAYYDSQGLMVVCQKVVYGEIEMEHRYEYHANGVISRAEISLPDEDDALICFDDSGLLLPT